MIPFVPRAVIDAWLALRKLSNWQEVIALLLNGKTPTRVVLKDGTVITSSQNPLPVVEEIFFSDVYTPPELTIGDQAVVIDIGANVGVFSVLAAQRTQATVYAVEPLPVNCESIQQNITENQLTNIEVVPRAVSDESGTVRLYTTESVAGNLLFDHNVNGVIEDYIEVPCTTLQALMDEKQLDTVDFLKLDCEGSEGAILQSTPAEYLQRIQCMAMEFHDNVSSLKHQEIQTLLEGIGFQTACRWNGRSPFGYVYAWRK